MALRLFVAAFAAALVFALAISNSPSNVSAHEHRTVAEDYEFVLGWVNEPTIATFPNGLSLRITFFEGGVPEEHDEAEGEATEQVEGVPVEGAEETLSAKVVVGGGAEEKDLTLEPAFQDPGHYESQLIPSTAGEYTFVITGTLPDGTEVNETFDSGPETFSSAEDPASLEFPSQGDSGSGGGDPPASESEAEDSDSDTAMIVAVVAIILAIVAAGVAIFAVARRRSS